MEQADSKHCPKSENGETHESHSWIDKDGRHSCDGDILTADEVFQMIGIHRRVQHARGRVLGYREAVVPGLLDPGRLDEERRFADLDPVLLEALDPRAQVVPRAEVRVEAVARRGVTRFELDRIAGDEVAP